LQPPQANGETIDAVAIDAANQSSIPTSITAFDITAPVEPSLLNVSADGTILTGRGEPGSTIRVVNAQGAEIGTAVVNDAGSFSVSLTPAQTDGQALAVTAQDAAGNTSDSSAVTAPNVENPIDTTPPAPPTGLIISAGGSQVSGRGEPGTTVNVRDAQGNLVASGTVPADGSFSLPLAPPIIDGSPLLVDLTDAGGNVSNALSVLTPDLTAPAQPTDLTLTDGTLLTGTGEPGATVQVRDSTGTLIGTGAVRPDGGFTLTLDPAQANGEPIDVRLTDTAGNTSAPLELQTPDIT
ncbi:Ig-like domain-containing protein, partial [Pseudomonas sp. RP23018S]|uniref:Ig-like domain-containing protein n=1 Tax=Pseudomonas sp. RP23018S TaxID=3096037 RepID=UPI002ACA2755